MQVSSIINLAMTISNNPKAAKRHSRRCGSDRIETEVRKARPADKAARAPNTKGKNRSQDLRVGFPCQRSNVVGQIRSHAARLFTHVKIMAHTSWIWMALYGFASFIILHYMSYSNSLMT